MLGVGRVAERGCGVGCNQEACLASAGSDWPPLLL